jgi:hypothetical protein
MKLPKRIPLLHAPSSQYVEAHIEELAEERIRKEIGAAWWSDRALDIEISSREIDRNWNWVDFEIEREGTILNDVRLGVVTGDGAIQGAMLISTEPVECARERGKRALFVEMLFAAPRNRSWVRVDKKEQYRGVGLELLRAGAELSMEAGCEGRLKLDASPGSVSWYKKRGLLEVSTHRVAHEGVEYTPMELVTDRVRILLSEG